MGVQAIELYRQMKSESIDEITHICILNACSHSGLVDEAREIFKNIKTKTDKIYTTMVYKIFFFFYFIYLFIFRLIVLVVHRFFKKHKN